MSLSKRPFDLFLVCCFGLFAFTSLAMEPYPVFHLDLQRIGDPLAAAWRLYASRWDPIFLDAPPWLRLICGLDEFIYGPFYLVLIYAFVRERAWVRVPALMYSAVITVVTSFYFLMELWTERHRASLGLVILINVPYLLVPLLLAFRLRRPAPFPGTASATEPATPGAPVQVTPAPA